MDLPTTSPTPTRGLSLPNSLLQAGSPSPEQIDPAMMGGDPTQGLALPPQLSTPPPAPTVPPVSADVPLSDEAASKQFTPGNNIQAVVQSDGTLAIHRRNQDGSLGPVLKVVKIPTGGG